MKKCKWCLEEYYPSLKSHICDSKTELELRKVEAFEKLAQALENLTHKKF